MHGSIGSTTHCGQQAPTGVSRCVPLAQVMSAQGSQPVSVQVGQQAFGSWTMSLQEAGSARQFTPAHDSAPAVPPVAAAPLPFVVPPLPATPPVLAVSVVPPPPVPPVFPTVPVAPPVVPVRSSLVPPFPPVTPVVPAVELVAPPAVPIRMPLPPLHPPAPTVKTITDSMVSFTKSEHTRFAMAPPVARDAGAMDALSTTRGRVPGNSGQDSAAPGLTSRVRRWSSGSAWSQGTDHVAAYVSRRTADVRAATFVR
jgi:hypothetical protein